MSTQPESEHEWTLHSINIHGVFFERRCQKAVAESKDWQLKSTNYPVEFPPPSGPFRGKESSLDIRAQRQHEDQLLTLLIECKKNNPEFVHWIFFPKHPVSAARGLTVMRLDNQASGDSPSSWSVVGGLRMFNHNFPEADEARETRGDYQHHKNDRNKTKTSNAAIQEAAYQVALATKAIFHEEEDFSKRLGMSGTPSLTMRWKSQVFLPAIVTSARLFTCEFDPADVDPVTGEIPYSKAELAAQPSVLFEYALPRHLQGSPADIVATLTQNTLRMYTRMHILVIHSGSFADVLTNLAHSADVFFI